MLKVKGLSRAFSLVELLVVIAIISILIGAAFAVLRPQDYIRRSSDSRRQSDLKVVQTALEQYFAANNVYPNSVPFGSAWTVGSVTYLRQVPNDPGAPSQNYCYAYPSPPGSTNYSLCANLEFTPSGTGGTCNAATYNYCLSNPF